MDWARGAAYVLMVIAHVAPSDGPARILLVSEFLTAPLFALLVGVGMQLGWCQTSARGLPFVLREIIRAALVVALGLWLAQSAAAVLIVLMHLGVLMVLCLPLVRLRTGLLAAAGAVALVLAVAVPAAYRHLSEPLPGPGAGLAEGPSVLVHLLGPLGGTGAYRLTGFLLCAILGMLAIRVLHRASDAAWLRGAAASILAFAAMLGLLVVPNVLGLYEVHAYDGTPSEQIGVAFGALGVLLTMWTIQASPIGRALPGSLQRMLAAPGQAALSLYALQILVLHVYQVANPTERDDHWWMLALLIAAGVGFAIGWQAIMRPVAAKYPAARVWVRGPLEGLIRTGQALLLGERLEQDSQALHTQGR